MLFQSPTECLDIEQSRYLYQQIPEGKDHFELWLSFRAQVLKNGPSGGERQVNGENKGPNKNEEVLIKVISVQ